MATRQATCVSIDGCPRLLSSSLKALVIQKRAEAKDYLDIHALLTRAGLDLAELLAVGEFLYRPSYSPELTLKSLCFYDDGNLASVPESVRRDLMRAVRACNSARLPSL